MNPLNSYVKMRNLKDNDKKAAERKYQESTDEFETKANYLYELLKKKEIIEEHYKQVLEEKSEIEKLQTYHNYLTFLTPTILQEQKKVDKARKHMHKLQEIVTEQHIEVKKMDKLIENKQQQFKELERKQDILWMDEISMRNYSQSKER